MSKEAKSPEGRNVFLICNAHLDPVWMWEWQEGAAETLSTFRVAAELCEKDKTFIFNHNEAILYEWVRQYEPALFERIKKLVRKGQWNIMGGWFLQPDCNMPSGESIVRQILTGKLFFKEHFGVDMTTAGNFDSFGHSRGLVQILAKSGYDAYMFGRPMPNYMDLPEEGFIWEGFAGTRVTACRFPFWYNTFIGQAEKMVRERIEQKKPGESFMVLWGMGNHGGGPSKKDLADLNRYIQTDKIDTIRHSTPQAYFDELKKSGRDLKVIRRDLNSWAIGCYISQIRVKQKHRELENTLYRAEKMASAAWLQGLMDYPQEEFERMTWDLCAAEFHDALPGSGVQPVEESTLRQLDHGLEIGSKVTAKAFFALAAGQPKAKEGQIPVLVYNPHPTTVRQTVVCDFVLGSIDFNGYHAIDVRAGKKLLPSQVEQEMSSLQVDWCKRVVFEAELSPGMNRFDCTPVLQKAPPKHKLKAGKNAVRFRTKDLSVDINTRTGLIDRFIVKGKQIVKPGAFEPVVLQDNSDSWHGHGLRFGKVCGRFRLMSKKAGSEFTAARRELASVRVVEDGAVRSIVEAVFSYGHSFLVQRYILPKKGTEIGIETRVFWNEKDKLLKLHIPLRVAHETSRYIGQVMYGTDNLPADGNEAVAQKWTAVVNRREKTAVTVINEGTYASDYSAQGLRLTLLRSPAYSCGDFEDVHEGLRKDRYTPRMDQGERIFRFWFNAGPAATRLGRIDNEALFHNETVYVQSFFPPGAGKKPRPAALVTDGIVQTAAIKKAQRSKHLIVRLFEPTGKKRSTRLLLPRIKKSIPIKMDGFEIKTLKIHPKTGTHKETDLLENAV